MKRSLWGLAVAFGFVASAAFPREVAVRSGEHNSFTRVVVLFPPGTRWNTDQDTTSITLSADEGPWEYDLSTAFRLIPRARILSMENLPDGKSLRITTTGQVHMTSFGLSRGGAVIDVSDGPAPAPVRTSTELPPYWRAQVQIPVPDERIQQAEQELLAQLGRAAAQGSVQVNPTRTKIPTAGTPNAPASAGTMTSHLALQAQTVMDRDLENLPHARPLTPQGQVCAPDSDFDPGAWLDARPFSEQISDARQKLVGEFDRPVPDQVTRLARVYAALGMSTEAQSVLDAFGQHTASDQALSYIAAIEDNIAPQESPFTAMRGCSGRVALWALIGAGPEVAADSVDFQAVQASFSSLPAGLRDVLGPRLIDILLQQGATDTAEAVRNTFRRSDSADRTSAQLAEGELDMARQDVISADKNLTSVAQGKDDRAARALALRIDATVEQGQAVSDADTQRAADFARLMGPTEDGLTMRRAESLGAASVGNFDHAFAILDNWPAQTAPQLMQSAQTGVFRLLATVPDDALFLSRYLPRQETVRHLNLPQDQQIALSRRLSALGFGPEAAHALSDLTKGTDAGRIAMARAAQAAGDTAGAITVLSGLADPEAVELRANALSDLGEHAAAARLYADLGSKDRAAREAWRSGSWAAISEFGTEAQKQAIQRAAPPAASPPRKATDGPLSRATDQIAHSQADRAAFQTLLQQMPPP